MKYLKKTIVSEFMRVAIEEARNGIYNQEGGPFGSVIVKDNQIIGQGHNMVLKNNDSTCHGEIVAIRNAEQNINSYDLSDCVLYTTGEPCPMCLAACLWANIKTIYYGCTIKENSIIGFRDQKFDEMLNGREKFNDYLKQIDHEACLELFKEYNALNAKKY